jgi:predicted glutamine amidotransferase
MANEESKQPLSPGVRLLGVSAGASTDLYATLARMLDTTAAQQDGWGVAIHDRRGNRRFSDPRPDRDGSALARFLEGYAVRGRTAVGYADREQPHGRELWGRSWSFAHAGRLRAVKRWALDRHRPVGTGGGEHAFCWLLDRLHDRWAEAPRSTALAEFLRVLVSRLWIQGRFDMLLTDGQSLFCFAGGALSLAFRLGATVDGTPIATIASRPVDGDTDWTAIRPGTFITFRGGVDVPVGREARSHAWGYGWMERIDPDRGHGVTAPR